MMPVMNGGNASVAVNLAASGAVLAAPGAGLRIRVWGYHLVCRVASDIKFQSNATDKTGPYPCTANGGLVAPQGQQPWFECAVNEALNLNMTVANTVGGVVRYDIV